MFNLKPPPKSLFNNTTKIPQCPPIFTNKGPIMIQGCATPNHTLYIRNLPEKFEVQELENLFSNYGKILKIYKRKGIKYKQQAFVVFEELEDAEIAIRALQGFPLGNLPMAIQYATNKSKIVAEKLGIEWIKGEKVDTIKTKLDIEMEEKIPPNQILLMQNLVFTKEQLESIYSSFAGFVQVRFIGVKKVVIFCCQ